MTRNLRTEKVIRHIQLIKHPRDEENDTVESDDEENEEDKGKYQGPVVQS